MSDYTAVYECENDILAPIDHRWRVRRTDDRRSWWSGFPFILRTPLWSRSKGATNTQQQGGQVNPTPWSASADFNSIKQQSDVKISTIFLNVRSKLTAVILTLFKTSIRSCSLVFSSDSPVDTCRALMAVIVPPWHLGRRVQAITVGGPAPRGRAAGEHAAGLHGAPASTPLN